MGLLRHRDPTTASPPDGGGVDALASRPQFRPHDFAAVYDAYFPAVYGYCLSQLGDRQAAEDATSRTFLKVLAALPDYRETGRFRPWLFAVAHNVVLDHLRDVRAEEPLEAAASVPDPNRSPEERTLAALDAAWLDQAIAHLSPDDRQVLELRRAGLGGREIAAVLGIGHEAAKKRQLRAIDRLRSEFAMPSDRQEARHGA